MTDGGLLRIVNHFLAAKTRERGKEIVAMCGDDYRPIAEKLLARLTFKRTLDQNRTYHMWLGEIARHMGQTKQEVERYTKLMIGSQILKRDDPKFAEFGKNVLKPLGYQGALEAMDYISVSSVMTTAQMREYMDEIERTYRAEGVPLTNPEDRNDQPS